MSAAPLIAFIGAGSTIFMKNIVGDILQRPALAAATDRADALERQRAGTDRPRPA